MKAFSIIYGSYHILEIGNSYDAIEMFTGKPSLIFNHSKFAN